MNIFNRAFMAILGIVAGVVGVAGLASSRGWISGSRLNDLSRHRNVWDRWSDISWTDSRLWVLIAAALVVMVLALVIATREILPPRRARGSRTIVIEQSDRGTTTLRTRALRNGLAHEASAIGGVSSAQIVDLDLHGEPTVAVRLRAGPDRDLVVAGREVCDRITRSLATVIGREPLRVDIQIDVRPVKASSSKRRVA